MLKFILGLIVGANLGLVFAGLFAKSVIEEEEINNGR